MPLQNMHARDCRSFHKFMATQVVGPPEIELSAILLPSLAVIIVSSLIAVLIAHICHKNGVRYSFDDQPA